MSERIAAQRALAGRSAAGSRAFIQATLDWLPAHVAVVDGVGEIIMTNGAWVQFALDNGGRPTGAGENYLAVCDAASADDWARRAANGLRAVLAGRAYEFSLEYPCNSPTEERWFVMRVSRYTGLEGARAVIAHDNVTARRQAEEEMRTQAALLDEVDVCVVATDTDGRITHWNRGAEHLYGWSSREVVGRPALEVIVPAHHDLSEVIRSDMLEHGKWEGTLEVFRKDGSIFDAYVRDVVMLADDATPTGTIAIAVDVSELVETERTLLASREYLRAVTDGMGEGVFTLDNDGCVTYINGAGERLFGWRADELMGRVMHEITHTHRADGSRLDIEDSPIERARRERKVVRIEQDVFLNRAGRQFPVSYTASPIETADGVQGCVVVFADISERLERERTLQRESEALSWIGRCKDAIAEERLLLYAQPIVDIATGEIVQRELLLRIREPDGTISPPSPYLQVAERYGLIGDIDRWVIQRAIQIAADHHPVQVNISADSVSDWTILDHIERCIEQAGADPASLVFEITETALASDQDAAVRFAELLREMGCKVALDDFGTGYGSFTYIKALPVDYLKIDMEFVRDVNESPASMRVVEAVVSIAEAFSAQTVAEGVEDLRTLERLRELGVDYAQGHYIARPGPIADTVPESPTQ